MKGTYALLMVGTFFLIVSVISGLMYFLNEAQYEKFCRQASVDCNGPNIPFFEISFILGATLVSVGIFFIVRNQKNKKPKVTID